MLDHAEFSPPASYVTAMAMLLAGMASLIGLLLVFGMPPLQHTGGILAIGAIATWRYTWQAIHVARSFLYQFIHFPRRRRSLPDCCEASHVYVVVLSYRLGAAVNTEVYGALLRELNRLGRPATVVACVTDEVDLQVLDVLGTQGRVRVMSMMQSGLGKRDAIEKALSLLAQQNPPPGAVLALMDGDTLVGGDTFGRLIPVLLADPALGAVTTDNTPLVAGSTIAREWYRLRMRDRHQLMCSMSLSRRVLVLTGRFSLYRAEIALSPGFIAAVGHDGYYHPRAGRIDMLTGDDKSTWFHMLQQGWQMIYVPDVSVFCLEKLPQESFFPSTIALMRRYFGNMTRNNLRAIKLMPSRIGVFPWLALIDQRLSPWSTLWGPLMVLTLTLTQHRMFIILYLCWVLTTRSLQSLLHSLTRPAFHPLFPFLQFYNQVVGAAFKINAAFHPDSQAWTRQKTGTVTARGDASSTALMWLALAAMTLGVIALTTT